MKPHDSVCTVIDTVHLPTAVTSYLESRRDDDGNEYIKGGMLESSQHAWLSSSSNLTVINVTNGQKVAAWTFGAAFRDFKPRITCVAELPTPLVEQTIQLLIGLDCELIGGMVCLFHCNGSRILRAIQIDCQVVCMQYIESLHGTALGCFDGAVLIGTHGGGAFIFDLNRYVCTEAIMNTTRENSVNMKDEFNIANLVVLSIDNISIIAEQRKIAYKKDHHIAVQINEGCVHNLQFILHNPDNTVKFRTDRENIFVTSTLYVPQLASIVIGLNIGVFQLWNLLTLELEFTSQLTDDRLPITHIGFMEPCDDPRAFCYIWALHSTLDRHDEGFPLAAMYSLTYQEKKNYNEQEYIYHNFLTCNLRFNIELSNVDGVSSMGKQLIGGRSLVCHTLSKTANKEDADEYVLNLCQIVWECWTTSVIAPVQSVMIIFDIDQWYKDHMPDSSILQTNNFMCVVNLGDTFAPTSNSYLCDVKINHETLTSYCSVQRLDEHFYPNSIGYECSCLTNLGITKLLTMGVQRQLLASINKIGPSILLHPSKLYNQCINTGLIPLYVDPAPTLNTPEQIQRQILLSVALEARLVQFLGKCAYDWASGSHTSTGCTLQLILEWSWSRASSLKQNGDLITIPFFDLSGGIPDKNSVQHLNNCVRQLGHIGTLYNIIIDKCSKYLLPKNITDIKQRQKIIQMITQYFQVIQWFLNVGLLPEFRFDQMSDTSNDKLPYPIESLIKFYQNRRLKLHCLSGENPANEELRNKCCKLLFIDELINMECSEKKLKGLWVDDESSINGLYPPPSLHSLLKVYLIPEIKEEYKHSLVLYMLIDYAMMFDDERYENVIRRLMQFPTMFGLSNTAIKVTQAFWHLDHRDFELALNQLQWVLTGGCLTQWQHNVVLSALLIQKKTQAALQYLHVRKPCMSLTAKDVGNNSNTVFDDWETCSNIYLSRGLVYEAFNLHRDSMKDCPLATCKERLKIFFEGCRKMGFLTKVLVLPLTQLEESVLVQFLKSIDDSHSNDILVLYYLRRSRYIEAQQVNEQLKRLTSKGQLPYNVTSNFSMRKEHVHKTETRDQLVDLYYKSLPPITRQLAHIASVNTFGQKPVHPTPFTVNVQSNATKSALYKSSYIQATIEKASEIWLTKPEVVRGIKRSFQIEETPFLCTPKLTKISSRFAFDEKMSTTPEESPSKRRKLNDNSNRDMSMEKDEEDAITPKLQKEIEVLLHTPLVERKSTWSTSGSINRFSADGSSMGREATPRSILKIRQLRNRMISSPIDERFLVETDDELDQKSDTLSRSIRFNIPSGENSPSPTSEYASDVQDSFSELCNYKSKMSENTPTRTHKREFSPSPRKSIHQSDDPVNIPIDSENDDTLERRSDTILEPSPEEIDKPETDNVSVISSIGSQPDELINDDETNTTSIAINSPKPRRSYRLSNISYQKLNESRKNSSKILNTNDIPETNQSIQRDDNDLNSDRFVEISSPLIKKINDTSIQRSVTKLNKSKLTYSINYTESLEYIRSVRDDSIPEIDDSILSEQSEQMVSDSSINIPEQLVDVKSDENPPEEIANVEASPSSDVDEMDSDDASKIAPECELQRNSPSSTLNVINASSEDVKNDSLENQENFSEESNQDIIYMEEDLLNSQCDDENSKLELFEENAEISEQALVDENNASEQDETEKDENMTIESIDDEANATLDNNATLKTNEVSSTINDQNTSVDKSIDETKDQTISKDESIGDDKNASFITCEDVSINNDDIDDESENQNESLTEDIDETMKIEIEIATPTNDPVVQEDDTSSDQEDNLNLVIDTTVRDDNINDDEEIVDIATNIVNEPSTPSKLSESIISHDVSEIKDDKLPDVILEEVEPLIINEKPSDVNTDVNIVQYEPSPSRVLRNPGKQIRTASLSPLPKTESDINSEANSLDASSEITASESSIKRSTRPRRKSKSDRKSTSSNRSIDNSFDDGDSRLSTPNRLTRSTSKLDTTIESSVDSDRESVSSMRKSRRSIFGLSKPNLSVIPELSHTEDERSTINISKRGGSSHNTSNVLDELSSRRMTRHQRSLLEKSLEISKTTIPVIMEEDSENSLHIDENAKGSDDSDIDSVSICSNTTTRTMDPILLLDKKSFEGQPDLEEQVNLNSSRASSVVSDLVDICRTPEKKSKLKRAVSEPRTLKRLKNASELSFESPTRLLRSSKKMDTTSEALNDSITDSPGSRLRRQSFNKAIEALSTPKRNRRLSTDSKASDSGQSLVANTSEKTGPPSLKESVTKPVRVTRRTKAASIHGNMAVSNLDESDSKINRNRARKSLISTVLSKEDITNLNTDKVSHYRKKIGVHRVSKPLQFDINKK